MGSSSIFFNSLKSKISSKEKDANKTNEKKQFIKLNIDNFSMKIYNFVKIKQEMI